MRDPLILCTIPSSANPKAPVKADARRAMNDGIRKIAAEHKTAHFCDLVSDANTGRYFGDRMLLTNVNADLSTEPDGMYISYSEVLPPDPPKERRWHVDLLSGSGLIALELPETRRAGKHAGTKGQSDANGRASARNGAGGSAGTSGLEVTGAISA